MNKPSAIYLDNNATTPLDPKVLEAMRPFLDSHCANPASPYTAGRAAALAISNARDSVAALVSAEPSEIIFTSGGTESNNTAIHSAIRSRPGRPHLITSLVEHVSVLNCIRDLESCGHEVTYVGVDENGNLDIAKLRRAASARTALISLMTANNETGVLFPVSAIAEVAHDCGALFHTDAVQAVGKIPFSAPASKADYVSLGAHKIHGPKGAGALFVRKGAPFVPYIVGGDQEFARRAGTENVPAIAGFGAAAEQANHHLETMRDQVRALRDQVEGKVLAQIKEVLVVARASPRLPNTTDFLIRGIDSDALIARLDLAGLCCSSGSACASGSHEPSHVLRAMGLPVEEGWGALRVSLSRMNTSREVDYLVEQLAHGVEHLRELG